ncbi:MAG TPA: prealbumin-like fold domain-containing protein [Thermoplasmata archaeon]|nr:prealbumin-like fold domain-containing protein [Thermoplasmata archaeon]
MLLIGVMALAALSVPSTRAVHDDNLFELGPGKSTDEGGKTNILGDGDASNGPDWANIFDGSGNYLGGFGGLAGTFIKDDTSQSGSSDRTTFSGAGGSNKNNDPIPPPGDTWHWDSGNVPAKDDLVNVYAYATLNPAGHLIIYAGFERLDPSGDSHIDVELFQDQVGLVGANATTGFCEKNDVDTHNGCHFSGSRTAGDLIISMDFLTGGALGSATIREWTGTQYSNAVTLTGQGCNGADTICAFNNGGTIDGGPWPNYDRHGSLITSLTKNSFTEFGFDASALFSETPCITTIMGKTRSSQSFTAELKDFAGPNAFPICSASIEIAPNGVNAINDPHTFTVTVSQTSGGTQTPAPDGTIVTVGLTASNGASVSPISDNCASPGTLGGTCTVTFTSPSAGVVTGHAAADVNIAGNSVHVETNGIAPNSGDATKVFVDASITIGPSAANEVGTPHTFTVAVEANSGDGAGFVPAPVGHVSFTLTDSNGASSSLNAAASTCDDAGDNLDALGQCTIVFTSNDAGLVTGHASVTLNVLGVSLTRSTNGVSPNSPDAVKRFVDASISITPNAVNEVGAEHTFHVTVLVDRGNGLGPVAAPDNTPVTVVLTDAGGASHTIFTNTCAAPGTSSGTCAVTFSSNSAGTVTGHAAVTLVLFGVTLSRSTDGNAPNSGDATKRFVDAFIAIGPSGANEVGHVHTFTVHVETDDGFGVDDNLDGSTFDPLAGAMPVITFPGGAPATVDASDCTAGTNAFGDCFVMINSAVGGIFTAHAEVTVSVSGILLTRSTDGTAPNSGDAVKRYVDAFITIGPSQVDEINDLHIFTVHVELNDGTGFAPAAGAIVTITWVGASPDFVDASDCADGTDASGDCHVAISSTEPGTFTAHASVDLLSFGVPLHRETDGSGLNSDNATKVFVDAFITIAPSQTNEVGTEHTFTVTVEENLGDGNGYIAATVGDVDFTLTDSNGAVSSLNAGASTCDDAGNNLDASGQCTIVFVSPSAGKVTGHASVNLDVSGVSLFRETDATHLNSGDAVKTYVDAFITLSPLLDTNEVNDPHTIRVHVEIDDGSGLDSNGDGSTFDPAAGGTPLISFPGATPAFVDASACALGTDANGNCDVIINSADAGFFIIHAAVTIDVGGVSLFRETNSGGFNSPDAVKVYVDAFITLSPLEAANEVNAEHVITATVMQDDGRPAADLAGDGVDGFGPAPDNTLVQFSFAFNSAGATFVGDDFCTTVGGSCSITITASSAGTVVVAATTTFSVGGVSLTRATGTGGQNSENAVKVFVDAKILIGPDDTNGIGEDHTFTVQVFVDYGGGVGPQAVTDGTFVAVSLSDAGGAVNTVSSDKCAADGTTGGICTITFTSNFAGTVTGHASVTLTVLGVTLTRETDNTHGSSGDAVKIFIAGSIVWHKVDNAGRPLGGATFEVCRTMTLDTSTDPDTMVDTPDVCISVLDDTDGIAGGTLDEDPAPGEFSLSGLVLGEYTVRESIAPPGYVKDPDTVTVDLTLDTPSVEITEPFRDARPSLKLTAFGYTNTPTGVPSDGVVSGTTVYSFSVKNFGGADALLDLSFMVSVPGGAGSGTVTYGGSGGSAVASGEPAIGDDCIASGCTVTWTGVSVAAGAEVSFTVTIVYNNAADGTQIRADLGATYTVDPSDGVVRTVSGAPAAIIFTVQAD